MSNEPTIEQSGFEKQIHAMAVAYADPKFRHGSFRWEHMVKVYKDAIREYAALQLMNLPQDNIPPSMARPETDPFNQSTTTNDTTTRNK